MTMQTVAQCPICGLAASSIRVGYSRENDDDGFYGLCAACGDIRIMRAAIQAVPEARRHLLSAFFRKRGKPEEVVTRESVATILRDLPAYSPVEKRDILLEYLADKTSVPGEQVPFSATNDYPVLFAANEREALLYVGALSGARLILQYPDAIVVTLDGWERVGELRKAGRTSERAFVAMSFNTTLNSVFDNAIRPAVIEAGYQAVRLDRTEHVNRIDDEIIAQLRECRFVIADFTQHRSGVYFEAGFGLGLGKTVIWICAQNDIAGLHFDTRQFNMIDYASEDELRLRLLNRILAVEGRGPRAA